jgi:hypothetical protein
MIRVSPKEPNPTHHISLSDGTTEIGLIISNVKGDAMPTAISGVASPRTALKTTTGNTKWSDLEPPWTAIAQESWSNGRGQEDEDDPERFYDSRRANTMFGSVLLSPLETYGTGIRKAVQHLPGSVEWASVIPGEKNYIAALLEPSTNMTVTQTYLIVRRRGTPASSLTIELCSNSAGNEPDTVLQTSTIATTDITDTEAEFYRVAISSQALTGGVKYWLKIYATSADENNHWEVGCEDAIGDDLQSSDGSTWEACDMQLYYRVLAADSLPAAVRFYQYKQQMFMVRSGESGAPTIWINGDWGAADANTGALGTLVDGTKSWNTDEWAGCIVVLVSGVGSNESKNWRTIVSNTATTLTVDDDWNIEHTTATNYVIVNSNKWTEITGHGLTAPVTDVLVVNENVYFAQGDAVNIRRANWYNNSGTWTARYADDGTNKAEKLCTVYDATAGLQVWKSNTLDASNLKSVAVATAASTWANMTFGTAITLLDDTGRINSMVEYGATKQPWLFREGTVFTISASKPNEIPLKEIRAMMSSENGIASLVHNIYLYFNLGAGIERYYDGDLLDMGLNKDAGLPSNRQGIVNNLIGYPGRFFATIDGSTDNYSALFGYNLLGWHEMYRAPATGLKIYHGIFQTIYGDEPDKLWLAVGQDVIWLAFPSLTVDPTKDPNVLFHWEGSVTSSWQYDTLFDVDKLWNSLKLFVEGVNETGIHIEVDYQVDDDTAWTPIDKRVDSVPMVELPFAEDSVNGKRIRYRMRLMSNDVTKSPKVKTAVIEGVSKVPIKYSYAFSIRTTDERKDLTGKQELLSAEDQFAVLDGWARGLVKLKMRSVYERFDDMYVFIDPPQMNPITENSEGYLDRITVTAL